MLNYLQRRYNRRAYKLRAKRRDAGLLLPGETLPSVDAIPSYTVKSGDTMFNISRTKPHLVNRKLGREENIIRVMRRFGMSRKGAEHMLPHLYNGAQFKEQGKDG